MTFSRISALAVCIAFSVLASSTVLADEPFKALELSSPGFSPSFLSFHAAPGGSSGVVVIAAPSTDGTWRVTNGRYSVHRLSGDTERLTINWATGESFVAIYGNSVLKVESVSVASNTVGHEFKTRVVVPPLQISASMSSVAHTRPVHSSPMMGSNEWALDQKLQQEFLRTTMAVAGGWFDE